MLLEGNYLSASTINFLFINRPTKYSLNGGRFELFTDEYQLVLGEIFFLHERNCEGFSSRMHDVRFDLRVRVGRVDAPHKTLDAEDLIVVQKERSVEYVI